VPLRWPGPSSVRKGLEKADILIDRRPHGWLREMRVVLLQIVLDVIEIVSGGDSPTDAHQALRVLSLKHGFNAGVHFFFFDKLPALGCLQSFFYTSQESGFFAEITDNNVGHQPLGGGPGFSGDLRKLGLLLRGEMHFHGLQGTKKHGLWQEDDRPTE